MLASAQELEAGASQKHWVQSQTTIAEIDRDTDGAFIPRVLKQKIWVEGISYELQEIFGMEYASGKGAGEVGSAISDASDTLRFLCWRTVHIMVLR